VANKAIEARLDQLKRLAETVPDARGAVFAEARAAAVDPDREIRTAAAEAVGALGEPVEALQWLGRLASDTDVGVRYGAVAALAGVPWRGRLDLLARALDDEDAGVVAVAADGLSYAGDRRAAPTLHSLVSEKKLQFGALEGLYALRDEQVAMLARQLFNALLTPLFEKTMAALILARAGDEGALQHLRRRAQKRYAADRGLILLHLAEVDPVEGRRILESVAASTSDDQRESALLALTRLDAGRWWPAAEKSLEEALPNDVHGAAEILHVLSDIDARRARPLVEVHRIRDDELGAAARRLLLNQWLRDAFPDEVLLKCV